MEKQNAFDDRTLINLVRYNYYSSKSEDKTIFELIKKSSLTTEERNLGLKFLEDTRYNKPMSVREMKEQIFAVIGENNSANQWGTTVNRAELEIIHKYILSTKKGK